MRRQLLRYWKGASLGEPTLMDNIGLCFANGRGTTANQALAAKWISASYDPAKEQLDVIQARSIEAVQPTRRTSIAPAAGTTMGELYNNDGIHNTKRFEQRRDQIDGYW